ncbi:MAG: hypothetical protein JWM63_1807 [Gammaproteobacteria bacterium]|nr:hypothetical protein [Gammaproteobacteria bacterium]
MASSKQEQQSPPLEVRDSEVHGKGVFAARQIKKGERIIEYIGERVSHDEADRRYEAKDENDSHTFLFIVDSKTVIDAGTAGNEARFFNHSCDPNCESVVESRRVFIEALRPIEPGEEMTYDYQIYREDGDPENIDEIFACRCGFPQCRGTMLWPPEPKKKSRKKARKNAGGKANGKSAAGGKQKKKKAAPAKRSAARKRPVGGKTAAAAAKTSAARKTSAAGKKSAGGKSAAGTNSKAGSRSGAGSRAAPGRKAVKKSGSAQKSASKAVKKSVRRR